MNLVPQTTFVGTPDDIRAAVSTALFPHLEMLAEMYNRVQPLPSILSIKRIAQDCCCSRETVRLWIVSGRKLPGKDKIIKLKVIDGLTDGRHLVRRKDYESFLDQFPSIRA